MRLCSLLAIAAALVGQQPVQPQLHAEKPGRITGKVLNAVTSEPVRKATVTLQPAGTQQGPGGGGGIFPFGGMRSGMSAATDNAGNFVFENVAPGSYRVSGDKTGFIKNNFSGRAGSNGNRVDVAAGSEKADVVVRLVPQGIVSGRILDEDGEPMEGVGVSLIRPQMVMAQRRFMGQGGNQTNDKGEFRINNVAPGKYYVVVQRMVMGGAPIQQAGEEFSYPRLFFPGVESLDQAQRIDVGPGQEFSAVQMTMRKARVYRVRGRVDGIQSSGDAAAGNRGRRGGGGMVVMLRPDGGGNEMLMGPGGFGPGMGAGQVRADGTFELASVTPGAYRLVVSNFGDGRPRIHGSLKLSVGNNNVEGVVVTPMTPVSFQGNVIVEGDKAAVNLKSVRIQANSDMSLNQPIEVAEDGTFKFTDLSPEKVRFSVSGAASTYLKAINIGGQDVKDAGIDLSSSGGGNIEVVLSTKVAKVDGNVEKQKQDDAPGTVIIAKVGPAGELISLNMNARVEDSGRFSLVSLPPGEYKLFAVEEVDLTTASDPEFLKKFEERAASVRIGEGESKNVSIKQIRYAETTSTSL
ncbi:MAG: carboxypeptidase regulatory-like domain-containing protein [Acidobacteria bacterium]|nr:carboxypeptidase regulatory-like domain-containing protein [Acidobacteriota bacterium]